MSGSRPPSLDRRTLLAAAAAGALATACATAGGRPSGEVAVLGDSAAWEKPMTAAGAAMKSVAALRLVPEVNPSLESFEQIVRSSLRTDKTPDMLKYWSGYRLQDLARTGGIEDLTGQWDKAAAKGWVEPSLREAFTYRRRVYGLPMNLAYWVIFYNPQVFREHGIDTPETWDGFLGACERLKKAGVTPLHGTAADRWPSFIWFQEILSRQDPRFYQDLMNGRERYTDPRAERALRTIASFFDKDWFTPMDLSHTDAAAALVRGTVGMVACGTWLGSTLAAAGGRPGKNVDAFVLPMADPGARPGVVFESSALVATVKGPDRTEALKATGTWLHPTVMKAFAHTLQDGCPNPRVEAANPVVDGLTGKVRGDRLWLLNRFWEQGPPELVEATVDDLAGFLLNPSSYRETLRTMQDRADDAWQVWREAEET
ncbi:MULTISPECIES: extracellular solute-binding protein [unclassified Streptomyces]|uniref:ABC transporter substrate-binding protein n=1 Tax=unclassified Streptomyces TaxID=2593676 RepID=UPI00136E3853|nr:MULTISPECIES: extracellular solute-binding protein [unclassified Streptomyces]NEA06051.1 extracellular solute-binding protein [Streptomyces sp. SID10116]MYY86138.1 extracellular solute-binding protein [Streptomyces sp. SID335]MYZ19576.1 extracellular solute-binding protein [Streptomyces sp. SID337]NDZ91497.1 extracellular solute-binding protein [Streptomyces sp. SID10115]NEB49897.1 extracellular solute-binding protein [Streptomyces sp. SID339]